MENENAYKQKLKGISNNELEAEYAKINRLRNETDEDYLTEFECLQEEANKRQYELMPERMDEKISLNANEFRGLWNWVGYDFINKNLLANPRLSDVIISYTNISRTAYKELKISDFDDKAIETFQRKHNGEIL